jgi:branched-chain amino acid transport system permease protein
MTTTARPTRARALAVVTTVVVGAHLVASRTVPLGVDVLGAVSGAALCLHAIAIVLVFRANRFVNFAQVQIGAVAATLFTTLVHAQPLIRGLGRVCPPCADRVTPALRTTNYAVALVLALAAAITLSWLTHALVVRRLARGGALALSVGTVFVAQALVAVQDALPRLLVTPAQRRRGLPVNAAAPPPHDLTWHVGRIVLHAPDVLLLATAAGVLALLVVGLRRGGTGAAVRASADHPTRASLLGIDVGRMHGALWAVSGLLAGLSGVLTAMTLGSGGESGGTPVTALVRLLAIAAIAGFASLPAAAAGALAIGVLDRVVFFSTGSARAVDGLLVLIVAAVFALERRDDRRADRSGVLVARSRLADEPAPLPARLRTHPAVRRWSARGVAALVSIAVLAPWVLAPAQVSVLALYAGYAIVALSLLVLTGWAGQVSLGQLAFAAAGAYVAAVAHLPSVLALVAGAATGAVAATLVGLPALRLRGTHLAVSTLALALAVHAILLEPTRLGRHLPATVHRPALAGIDLNDPRSFFYAVLVLAALAVVSVMSARRSRVHRALLAARDNESAAAAFGIDITRARLAAFAYAGALAGLAGVVIMWAQHSVASFAFSPEQSVRLFTIAVLGGLGAIAGPLLGTAYAAVLALAGTSPLVQSLGTGVVGLAVVLAAPGGLLGVAVRARTMIARRLAGDGRGAVRAPIAPGPVSAPRYELDGQWAVAGD